MSTTDILTLSVITYDETETIPNIITIYPYTSNPLSQRDTSGIWRYYLHYYDYSFNFLHLNIASGKALTNLYYVINARGGAGGKVGTINTTISAGNYPGGGGGGGSGQIYPMSTKQQPANSPPVSISNPEFPYYISMDPSGSVSIKNNTGFYTYAGCGTNGKNGNSYNGGNGGTTIGQTLDGILTGIGGYPGGPNGTPGNPTKPNNPTIVFADNTPYIAKATEGGYYNINSNSSTNGYGQGAGYGYVMFYYNIYDVKDVY